MSAIGFYYSFLCAAPKDSKDSLNWRIPASITGNLVRLASQDIGIATNEILMFRLKIRRKCNAFEWNSE